MILNQYNFMFFSFIVNIQIVAYSVYIIATTVLVVEVVSKNNIWR